jgi:hypothetical protein
MKCVNCSIEVSPSFVACIIENRCPACGQQLMDGSEYKKLMALRKQLVPLGLGLDESTLTKVAAAITSRFELWPRDSVSAGSPSAPVVQPDVVAQEPMQVQEDSVPQVAQQKPVPRPIKPLNNKASVKSKIDALMALDNDGIADDDADFHAATPQTAAQIVKEWGLDKGDASAVAMVDENVFDNDLNSVFAQLPLQGEDPMSSRMSRAHALGETANKFGIKPIRRT